MAEAKGKKKAASAKQSQVTNAANKVDSEKPRPVQGETIAQKAGTKKNPLRVPVSPLVAELIGTFLLAAVVIAVSGQQFFVMFALVTIVLVIGHISGAHVNPAITIGAWVTRQISSVRAIGYIVAQFAGAIIAVLIMTALINTAPAQPDPFTGAMASAELFTAAPLPEGKEWYAFLAEIVGAAVLGFGVATALRQRRRIVAAFSVGGALFIGLLIGGATAVLNPAVAVAIQAIQFETFALLVYILGTGIGAILGFALQIALQRKPETT